ncbi:nucleosome-remodeling factor subunit NURF301-like isoform X2 [Mizuhopecten yessoensis]|uniref:Nucleosome-remodeling factor subunit NURF301 n=1 Tax=Mizuhopecten yessoensis TaxID=6573 RepID=A0A210QCJ6_MIZYE|nr:nucleosome-remodeling factor subunit NURF301-like isoform X2 [Mizuhopecten yessoensis]OWF46473.1 Nucleosome-remodeling factor subunit NURF301 [Mizuhopecten yessoensis]
MSTRGRRGRGRPPKTPLSSVRPRSNFLRKPKAYQNHGTPSSDPSSRSSTPVSTPGTPVRGQGRGRSREAAQRGRHFIQHMIFEDDDQSRSSIDTEEKVSDVLDDLDENDPVSDASYEESDSDCSNDSFSTIGSSAGRRKLFFGRRPRTPELLDDKDIARLKLPPTSTDLMIPIENLMQSLSIYEVLRHFRTILRLSPFSFEDFCAAIMSDEVSSLLTEIHITLYKALWREEDGNNTAFGPSDMKDSINISLFFVDAFTWPESIRALLDTESDRYPEYKVAIESLEHPDFPFVPVEERLKVLKTLTDLFLVTNNVREEIMNEGNIQYDDHCRNCHKLGDLLCCETCSAVYHLTCVEPPMEEVPEEDWVCGVCRAHKIKGVTDCVSEAEKSGLLCRQEPIGFDRHGRKYWFLVRRIVVEGENEVWYYSTKGQIDELLEVLDSEGWERDLVSAIYEFKEDVLKQMAVTHELTMSHKGNRKSALELETAEIVKTQAERSLRKAQEETERKIKEEEEDKRKKEEEESAEKRNLEGKDSGELDGPKENGTLWEKDEIKEETQLGNLEKTDMDISELIKTETTTSVTSNVTTSTTVSDNGTSTLQKTELLTTTTTTSTLMKSITTISESSEVVPKMEDAKEEMMDQDIKTEVKEEIVENNIDGSETNVDVKSEQLSDLQNEIKQPVDIKKIDLKNLTQVSVNDKPKSTIMNVQSVCPNVKQTVLKMNDDSSPQKQTRTVLIVNRDGNKVTLAVSKQPLDGTKAETTTIQQTSTTTTASALAEARKIVTRSKTGSLTPKQFTDSITGTTSVKTLSKLSSSSSDDLLVINKDGDITRVTRSKSATVTSLQHFKLGMECNFKNYVNQYATNNLALNKYQHNEERDKRRYLSHKFSLTQASEFKWNGANHGKKSVVIQTLMLTIIQLESSIPSSFLHPNWPLHRQSWTNAVHMCRKPSDFSLALSILEACMKPVIFNPVWSEALGHCRLQKITSLDREEMKKREKEIRKRKEEEDEGRPLVWIKYTLGLKHQVWKQRGEEYRVTGGQGWRWLSTTRKYQFVPQDTVGLRNVARKIQARKRKAADATPKAANASQKTASSPVSTDKTEGEEEHMDVDQEITEPPKTTDSKEDSAKEDLDSSMDKESVKCNSDAGDCHAVNSVDAVDTNEETGERVEVPVVKDSSPESADNGGSSDKNVTNNNEGQCSSVGDDKMEVDIESVSPVKKSVSQTPAPLKSDNVEKKLDLFNYTLPPKLDIPQVDVCRAMNERTHYPKVTKPYAKLDLLLQRRLKQEEIENKQRQALQQQINWKLKSQNSPDGDKKDDSKDSSEEKDTESKEDKSEDPLDLDEVTLPCYSYSCREKGKEFCFSPTCRKALLDESELIDMDIAEDAIEAEKDKSIAEMSMEDEDVDIEGDKEEKMDKKEKSEEKDSLVDVEKDDEGTNKNTNSSSFTSKTPSDSSSSATASEASKTPTTTSPATTSAISSALSAMKSPASRAAAVAQLLANRPGLKAFTQAQLLLKQAIEKMSVQELKSKMPPARSTKEPIKLVKYAKFGQKPTAKKKASLPPCHKYLTPSRKRSALVLEKHDLRKMARTKGLIETKQFNYNCKMNNVNWIYPCPRPLFRTSWRYRTQTVKSFGGVGLQLRILWACLRWDDLSIKPPAGGTNTVSTETEITTKELLKRRDVGRDGLRSEFQVRKIVVPLGLPSQPKEKYTPQRSGLRERRRAESPKQTEPSVTETWTPEEELELWEIKQFGEKLAKQRAAIQEKSSQDSVKTTVNAVQLKAQLEMQLKQQRLALQQKRMMESQGSTTATTTSTVTVSAVGTTSLISTVQSTAGGTIIKPATTSNSILGGTSILKTVQVQPKTIIAGSQGTPGRSLVRFQIPRSAVQQIQSSNSSNITLAPKPGLVATAATTNTVTSPARVVVPAPVSTAQSLTPKVQLRPQVVAQGVPGQVQNLQIIQGPQGQLQVRGLLPGQQIIRLPDGRLQLLSMPQTPQVAAATPTPTVTPATTVATPTLVPPRTQLAIRPQTSIIVTNATGGTQTATTPARIIIPSQNLPTALGSSSPGISLVSAAKEGGLVATVVKGSSPPSISLAAPKVIAPGLVTGSATMSGTQAVTMTTSSAAGALASAIKTITLQKPVSSTTIPSPITVTSLPQMVSGGLPKVITATRAGLPGQLIVQTPRPPGQPLLMARPQVPTTVSTAPVTSVSAAAATKYAVTPQVVQQVVRQALMQNQTPEIQAKLLAMQRLMTQPKTSSAIAELADAITISTASSEAGVEGAKFPIAALSKTQTPTVAVDLNRPRQFKTTVVEKEEQNRLTVCGQVLRNVIEKIEKKERDDGRRMKKQEMEEEKHKRLMVAKLQGTLFKHKEALKKEILKKRSIMEKNLQQEIQAEVNEQLKKRKKKPDSPGRPLVTVTSQKAPLLNQDQTIMTEEPKRKKQKIISTGGRAFNPKEKLYCVCKLPYDTTKFYIGCDLCSNWFHGDCVGISEGRAKTIDTYVCGECKKQKETATEELYCLCRTPYDEAQFYIGCDRCQDWFHGRCVGVSQGEADHIDTYICPNCMRKEEADPVSQKELLDRDYDTLRRLVKSLQSHKMAWPFLEAVDRNEVPDYYHVVKDPMDLTTVEKRLQKKKYHRLKDFVKDVTKIFDNCRLYNPTDTPFYQCAEVLETFFVQKLKSVKERI